MLRSFLSAWLPCAVMLLSSAVAMAQSVDRTDPATAAAAVPPPAYESPFARYRVYADQEVAPWRETNDTAARMGGWRAYAREAAESPGGEKGDAAPAAAGGDSNQHMPMHMHKH